MVIDAISSHHGAGRNDTPDRLPRWDMTRIFPSLESDAFRAAFDRVTAGIGVREQISRFEAVAAPPAP